VPLLYAATAAYNGGMAKQASSLPIDVICPCCKSKLTIDPQLAVVLSHTEPAKVAPDVAIEDAARILADQAQRREDKFRESWDAEQKKEDVLERKFEEALKKAKEQPASKPIRHFDLE
jgi:hypothetical protein